MAKVLKIGLPKGSLQESTLKLFRKAGYQIGVSSRSYYPSIDDPELECMLIRAQEMAGYVEKGIIDCGLTGKDWLMEQNAKVHEVAELIYAKEGLRPIKWVVAVPEDSKIKKVKVKEGRGRRGLLEGLEDELKNERITEGEYIVVISKIPENWNVSLRRKAIRNKGGGRKKGGYQY